MTSEPVVQLDAALREFPGPVRALGPVSLRIDQGEYVSIMGPSGSGKSTMLNLLGLLDSPTDGKSLFLGEETESLSESQRTSMRGREVGFVFQAFHLMRHRSALENVALSLLYRAVPRREREQRATELLDRVGLAHRASVAASKLSGGEQQRVAIARAVLPKPALLLLDEPTGALDQASGENILDLIDEFHGEGMTICMITHDPQVGARAQRTIRLRDGRIDERSQQ